MSSFLLPWGIVHKSRFASVVSCLLSAIGNAYAVLSNAEKRKHYDKFGGEKVHPSRQGHAEEFEADISPEDLFNMFFGGGFPSSKSVPSPLAVSRLWADGMRTVFIPYLISCFSVLLRQKHSFIMVLCNIVSSVFCA